MANTQVNQVLSAYQSFLSSPLPVNFICINGSAGSQLVHSLLDSHPEVLTIPTIFSLYFDWKLELENYAKDPKKLVGRFFEMSAFRFQYNGSMGRWVDKSNPELEEEIRSLSALLEEALEVVLRENQIINAKDFFILIHYAYAVLKNQDISKVKIIVNHHHHGPFTESSFRFYTAHVQFFKGEDSYDLNIENPWLTWIKKDFPRVKFTYVIRHPYDLFCSTYNYKLRADGGVIKLCHYFYLLLYLECLGWNFYVEHSKHYPDEILFIKLEELHTSPKTVIPQLAQFLEITENDTLYESTYSGEKWFGSNPHRPVNGFNPRMAEPQWPKLLPKSQWALNYFLFSEICRFFKYESSMGPHAPKASISTWFAEIRFALAFITKDILFLGSQLGPKEHWQRFIWIIKGLFNKHRSLRTELVREIAYIKFLTTYRKRKRKLFEFATKQNFEIQKILLPQASQPTVRELANEF